MGWLNWLGKGVGAGVGFATGGPGGAIAGWGAGDKLTGGNGSPWDGLKGKGSSGPDWWQIAGAGADAYGSWQEGKSADEQLAWERDKWREEFDDMTDFRNRQYADSTAFRDQSYADERADVDYGRDFRKRQGQALQPMLGKLLTLGKGRGYG